MDPGAIACVVWLVHNPHGQACMCAQLTHWCVHCRVHTRRHGVCARPQWLPCGHVQAGPGSSLALPAGLTPLPRVPGAGWGWAGPETSRSCCAQFQGSHPPPACCPQSPPAFAPAPWASRKARGRPCPQPCMPESTAQTHLVEGVCSPLPLEPSEPLTAGTSRRDSSRGGSLSRRGN